MNNPHKKLLYNPLAAEFGIENMMQMNEFIRNQLPTFKMVSPWKISGEQISVNLSGREGR